MTVSSLSNDRLFKGGVLLPTCDNFLVRFPRGDFATVVVSRHRLLALQQANLFNNQPSSVESIVNESILAVFRQWPISSRLLLQLPHSVHFVGSVRLLFPLKEAFYSMEKKPIHMSPLQMQPLSVLSRPRCSNFRFYIRRICQCFLCLHPNPRTYGFAQSALLPTKKILILPDICQVAALPVL